MSPFLALLVLVSAAIHPVWNLLLKRNADPRLVYLALTATLSLCGLVHALIVGADILAAIDVFPLLALSWSGQILYGTCLTATLVRGDLSAYYPIIRASPVFIVIVGVLFLGRHYSTPVLMGIAMAVSGGFLLLYRRGTNFLSDPMTLGLALLAMIGTGIYSITDSYLMQTIAPPVQMFWIESMLFPYFLAVYFFLRRRRPAESGDPSGSAYPAFSPKWFAMAIGPGLLAYFSYFLILYAYQNGGEVAAVTSVRQASIPISVLLAGYFLREGSILRRLIASLVLAAGIVVIVWSG